VDGRGGPDVVAYINDATSGITVDLSNTGPQTIGGGMGVDTLRNVNAIGASHFDDHLIGNSGNNTIIGNAGSDTIEGGGGNDVIFGNGDFAGGSDNDQIDGGAGFDIVRFTGSMSDYSFKQQGGAVVVTDLRPGSPDGTDTISHVEAFQFAPFKIDDNGLLTPAPTVPVGLALAYTHLLDLAASAPAPAHAGLEHAAEALAKAATGLFPADPFV
jgi:hypothetical protein